jgi:hypothetical protein
MAACDNLYGNSAEWQQLKDWMVRSFPRGLKYLKKKPCTPDPNEGSRICYIPEIQGVLNKYCPLPWVKERLEINFYIQTAICGKAHHE